MKNVHLLTLGFCLFGLMSCSEKDLYQGGDTDETEKTANTFDFATTSEQNVTIAYRNMGCKAMVYFEIYDQNPLIEDEEGIHSYANPDIKPLYTGYTDGDGVFSGTLTLPAYLKKAYIYSPDFFSPTLLTADVVNGAIVANDDAYALNTSANTRAVSRADANEVISEGWKTWLGDYNATTGKVDYTLGDKRQDLQLTEAQRGTLLNVVGALTQSTKDSKYPSGYIPTQYACEGDIKIGKDAEVALTFLAGNTCWTSSLGYYYYKEGNAPQSYDELRNRVIMLFPNTIDGKWENWNSHPNQCTANKIGVTRGDAVQLMFYGDDMTQTMGTTQFPKGYCIGFVLATDSWSNTIGLFNRVNKIKNRAATCHLASQTTKDTGTVGPAPTTPRTAVFKNKLAEEESALLICFEDAGNTTQDGPNNSNYTDVVVATKTNPFDALEAEEVENIYVTTTATNEGIYCFEDQWPAQKDYDMNDVMVDYQHSRTTLQVKTTTSTTVGSTTSSSTTTVDPHLKREHFIFTTYKNYATLKNRWAFKITEPVGDLSKATISVTANGEATTNYTLEDGNTFLMGEVDGKEYQITVEWSETNLGPERKSEIQCFAYRPEGDSRWEVHIPYEAPTSKAVKGYFNTEDDLSATNNWYTCAGNYPFAFFLAGATHDDFAPLLDINNETHKISEVYPNFLNWVTSPESYPNWYKKDNQ